MPASFSFTDNPYARPDGTLKHDTAKSHHAVGTQDFVGVDGEGMTLPDGSHGYVLLGVGEEQIEDPNGLQYTDIFTFLSAVHRPRTAFAGFYLGYDFTQWLKTLPEERARALLTIDGREGRRSKSAAMRGKFLPVDVHPWQIDMLGSKRLQFRRKDCHCPTVKCEHPKGPWIYVCDSGPFFQTSFLNVIDPANWQHPICSADEYETIQRGKAIRDKAVLDDDMRFYNRLENRVLSRVLHDLNTGFQKLDVNLAPSQWYGPGQAAQSWMKGRAPTRKDIENRVPTWFSEAARASYFGGWFEQFAHGLIPGESHENDINNAYPFIISQLPCLLHGTYSQGDGIPTVDEGEICLVRTLVWGSPPLADKTRGHAIGAMLHRDKQGRISRPLITAGWYWWHELQAARRAKVIRRIAKERYYEWVKYTPCDCPPPLRQAKHLYQMRIDVGKASSLGKSAKLVNNSCYGKLAQSVGLPQFANPVYASLITAGCRTMILDAIATHPGGKSNVVMVATDAVFFLDPHPLLAYGKGLGEWEHKSRTNLTLFKPGVYWDDEARETIRQGEHISFKARGISARDFAGQIARIDEAFATWGDNPPPVTASIETQSVTVNSWPKVTFTSSFAMTTALQALMQNKWETAGAVDKGKELVQNANPADKRADLWLDRSDPARPLYRSEPHATGANAVYRHADNVSEWGNIGEDDYSSVPYEKKFGLEDPFSDENTQAWGITDDEHQPFRGVFRMLTRAE